MSDISDIGKSGVGSRPLEFTLPEVGSGVLRSAADFIGRPTILYMWASW
jgi:hypothetical protein